MYHQNTTQNKSQVRWSAAVIETLSKTLPQSLPVVHPSVVVTRNEGGAAAAAFKPPGKFQACAVRDLPTKNGLNDSAQSM